MKYKLVIFDLDGTILDTLKDLTISTNYALEKNGFSIRTIDEVRAFVGNGIKKLIERALSVGRANEFIVSEETVEKVLKDFSEHYKEHCADETCPYDGIMELLKELKKRKYLTAVVSNKADFAVQELCEDYFHGLFDYVVGERADVKKKPAPDTVNEVLARLQTAKADTLYVGDSDVDIETAKNAGITCISVTWGFRDEQKLNACGAKYLVNKPEEILTFLSEK